MARLDPGPPLHLLLVEDDPGDRELFCLAAARAQLNLLIHAVFHGQHAIEYLEGKAQFADRSRYPLPEVLVLDLKMPLVDGWELLRWLRASPIFRTLPGVAVSGWPDEKCRHEAETLGADLFFAKPSDLGEWAAILREVYKLARGAGSAAHPAAAAAQAASELGRSGSG